MFKNKRQQSNLKSGFSLVEMLVAVGVFMSIMTIAITALLSIISANKKAQTIKSTIDVVTFAVDDISRDMRTGTGYQCLGYPGPTSDGEIKDCKAGSNIVKYVNNSGGLITYIFNGDSDPGKGVLTKTEGNGVPVDLISQVSNAKISTMKFYVIGADCESGGGSCVGRTQPRVVITVSGLIHVSGGGSDTAFNLQTNISQKIRI